MTVVRLSQSFLQLGSDEDTLRDEFLEYRLQDDAEMPKDLQVDKFLGLIGRKKIAGEQIFRYLAALMKLLLCIPHSNSFSKKTFSVMRKIVTENRISLHNDTVCALLSWKINCDRSAVGFKPFKVGLNAAKKATNKYNQAHKSQVRK